MQAVVSERRYTAIDRPWNDDEERRHLMSLSPRETFHIAVDSTGRVIGCQSLERYFSMLPSMSHVGQVGTFILPDWRGRGVGRALFDYTKPFAVSAGYRKLVIQVRGTNVLGRSFYERLGFVECGRLRRQVVIDGNEDDEVIFELFLD
jgi:RimJ/RimL family protein N-acetyltransferase